MLRCDKDKRGRGYSVESACKSDASGNTVQVSDGWMMHAWDV